MARSVTIPSARDRSAGSARSHAILCLAVFTATVLVYLPAFKAGFIWNDSDYVTTPALRSVEGFWRIWFELGATEQYYPVLHSAFWLEHKLWGDSPRAYHVLNVLLHASSACLLAIIVRRLAAPTNDRSPALTAFDSDHIAWLAAFMFALHPVYVESVAWISEQKNTLSLVFYLLAALLYLRFDAKRRLRVYVAATVIFIVALLTKSVTATLPAALLLLFWWQRGRLEWRRDVFPLVPWFTLGAGMGLLSSWVERVYIGAHGSEFALTLLQRCLLAGRIVWFYVGKLLWPSDLIFIYPRWNIAPGEARPWVFLIGVFAVLGGLWWWCRRSRAPLAAALFFGGSLFPTLGFFNVYAFRFSFVADHWQYLPSIGLVVLMAAALQIGLRRVTGRRRAAITWSIAIALGLLSFHQSRMYADMPTFYATTLARNPNAWMAHNNLANILREQGDLAGARGHLEAALRLRPDLEKVHNNLGLVLRDQRRYSEAIEHYERALQLMPTYSDAHNNLGSLLREQGRTAEAIQHLFRALQIDPAYVDARNNLGMALRDAGRVNEAIVQFERVVRERPDMAAGHLNLALSLSLLGRTSEAMQHYRNARRLNPAIPELPDK